MSTSKKMTEESAETFDPNIKVYLLDQALWKTFYKHNNEMVVTRKGRRMFPGIRLSVHGLAAHEMYSIALEFPQTSTQRLKYVNGAWHCRSPPVLPKESSSYWHESSPMFGNFWVFKPISFHQIKISNKETTCGQVKLNTLHRYEPVVKIFRLGSKQKFHLVYKQPLEFCSFVAVTGYRNKQVTSLKVRFNPFAKAFSEKEKERRKSPQRHSRRKGPPLTPNSLKLKDVTNLSCPKSEVDTISHPFKNFNPILSGNIKPLGPIVPNLDDDNIIDTKEDQKYCSEYLVPSNPIFQNTLSYSTSQISPKIGWNVCQSSSPPQNGITSFHQSPDLLPCSNLPSNYTLPQPPIPFSSSLPNPSLDHYGNTETYLTPPPYNQDFCFTENQIFLDKSFSENVGLSPSNNQSTVPVDENTYTRKNDQAFEELCSDLVQLPTLQIPFCIDGQHIDSNYCACNIPEYGSHVFSDHSQPLVNT